MSIPQEGGGEGGKGGKGGRGDGGHLSAKSRPGKITKFQYK